MARLGADGWRFPRRAGSWSDVARAAALALLVAFLWAYAYGRLDPLRWSEPLSYGGDAWAFLAALKAACDGHVKPLATIEIPELNAPFEASWNDFPNRQPTLLWLAAIPARRIGLFATVSLLLLLAHVAAALSFYSVARTFRARWEWALAGAFTFAFSPYIFLRGDRHLALSLYAHLPLLVLVLAWALGRRGLAIPSRRFACAAAVAALAGLGNFYYAALFVQFLLLAALAQALRRRGRAAVIGPLVLASIAVAFVLAENAHYLRHRLTHGPNPAAVVRGYGDVERLALKPIELFLPVPGHGLFAWGTRVRAYWLGALASDERGPVYLGLLGVAALGWVLFVPAVAVLRGRPVRVTAAFGAVAWILAYSVVGGLNGLVSLVGPAWLRATNRFSIWLLAVVLLAACLRLSRAGVTRPRIVSLVLAGAAGLLAWADQATVASATRIVGPVREAATDRAFVRSLEASLPGGAMLFQLPVLPFPEAAPVERLRDYEPFRPYLFASHLRFSYGTDRGRPRDAWQARVARQAPESMVAALERYGFAGILVNRRGYADAGESLLRGLAATGRPAAPASEGNDLVLVPLRPREPRERPGVPLLFGRGWEEEGDPEGVSGGWSTGDAEWILTNDRGAPADLLVSFELAVLQPRQVTLRQGRRLLGSWRPANALSVGALRLELPPGETRVLLQTDRPAEEAEVGDGRPLAFRVARLRTEWDPPR